MSSPLNQNLLDTATPPIPEAYEWAARYDGGLGPLINMAQAAPSMAPPAALLERLAAAAADPESARYGPIDGDDILKEALAREINALYGGDVAPGEIAITAGCNLAFVIAMLAVAKAGEAVLLPAPWYFNHEMALRMLGIEARVLPVGAETGFVPDIAVAEPLVDDRVRAIALVSPNNPTGAVYPPATLAAFADLCRRRGLWLVLDETYRDFLPDGAGRPHALFRDPSWRASVMQLYSFSKAFCVPGYRLGAITAPAHAMAEIGKALDTVQICPPRAAQSALAWALTGLDHWRARNRREINDRAAAFRAAIGGRDDWRISSIGSYFAYVRHPFAGVPSRRVAERLAETAGVLALPGSYFGPGQDDHLRIAFANVEAVTMQALPVRLDRLSL